MRRNLDFYRGATKTFSGVLRDSAGVVDLTNATLVWYLGDADGRQTRLTLTESDGITVSASPETGAWSITVDPADTADLDPGYYQQQGTATIGTAVYTFTQGRVRLRRNLE